MDEIKIKDVIKTLLKGKFVIVGITVLALLTGILVHFVTPRLYRSTVSMLTNPIFSQNIANSEGDFNTSQLTFPDMDILEYRQQFLNNYTLTETIQELDLRDNGGNLLSIEALRKKIRINVPERTRILEVSVSDKDPEMSALITNTLAKHFIDYINEIYRHSADISAKAIYDRVAVARESLSNASIRLRDYLIEYDSLDVINSRIAILIQQITILRSDLNLLEINIAKDANTIAQIHGLLDSESMFGAALDLGVSTSITANAANTGEFQLWLGQVPPNELESFLHTLKLTDLELQLIENLNMQIAKADMIIELEDRLSDLQAMQAEAQYRYNEVLRDFTLAENVYEIYVTQHKQAELIRVANLGNVNITVMSNAIPAAYSYNRNAVLTCGVAGVLGVFAGVFIVLFVSYWKREDEEV
jgi:uncharacterized protein involved in exopolysaccharide biosynthesis